jgi:radical SAM superfamily enzyme YgiQ (UPF0313 family)
MKILFYYRGRESLGIEYLSAVLKRGGHTVDLIFDPGLDNNFYWNSKLLKIFHNEELMIEKAERFSPDLVAFSSTTNEYPAVCRIAHILKERLGVPAIVGGIHPTSLPEFVLSNPDIDMICRGEGELSLLELADRMEKGKDYFNVPNIWFKKRDGSFVRNELRTLIDDLDMLPFPDKELFYQYGCFKDLVQVISGRGCPFSCSYCHNNICRKMYQGKGRYIRRRSVANMISELKFYKEKYHARRLSFQDDLFLMDREWLNEFSKSYIEEITLPFSCNAFPSRMNEESISLLEKMGCMDLFIGIDSGNETLRREVLKRDTPTEGIRKSIQLIKNYHIPIELSAVFCFPGETVEQMWETINLVDELNPSAVQSHMLFPFPKTEIFENCKKMGLIDEEIEMQIYKGAGSIVGESVLKHPDRDVAYVLVKMMAMYVKLPGFLKPLFRRLMNTRMKTFANAMFLITIPLVFPWQGITRLRELFRMVYFTRKKLRVEARQTRNKVSG